MGPKGRIVEKKARWQARMSNRPTLASFTFAEKCVKQEPTWRMTAHAASCSSISALHDAMFSTCQWSFMRMGTI